MKRAKKKEQEKKKKKNAPNGGFLNATTRKTWQKRAVIGCSRLPTASVSALDPWPTPPYLVHSSLIRLAPYQGSSKQAAGKEKKDNIILNWQRPENEEKLEG